MTRVIVGMPTCEVRGHARGPACSYRVAWSINPHMVIGAADPTRAARQHARFVHALRDAGADVVALPFIHGAYDSIFAKDCAVLIERGGESRALLASPRTAERRGEAEHRARHLIRAGFAVERPLDVPLEGGDVVLDPAGRFALLGTGFRSSVAAAPELAAFLGIPVLALELVDPRLYHLDMAATILADGTALVCDEALTGRSRAALRELPIEVVPVSTAAALRFAINLVELGDVVITGGACDEVTAFLHARGRDVVAVELDEFHHAGGSAACLVARVHRYATVADSATTAIRSTAA